MPLSSVSPILPPPSLDACDCSFEPVAEQLQVEQRVRVGGDEARHGEGPGQREPSHGGSPSLRRGLPTESEPLGEDFAAPSRHSSTIPAVYLVAHATPSAAPASA